MTVIKYSRTVTSVILLGCQVLLLIPLAVYYSFSFNRPYQSFTLHQTLSRKLMFELMQFYTRVRLVTPMPTEHKLLGSRFVSIAPSPDPTAYRGPLQDKIIKPVTVRGVWYPQAPNRSSLLTLAKEHGLLVHFHGGGYVLGSPFPLDSGYMASVCNQHITPLSLFVGYRLTCTSMGRFPAALQDAVTVYLHLLDQGVAAENIIISGDSAGGHLAISLLLYIKEYLPNTPSPWAALLWSPWIDVEGAALATHVARRKNYRTDYLPAEFAEWATESLAPKGIIDRNGAYVTLNGQSFLTTTKIWVHVGDLELLYDEIKEWVFDTKEAGNDVTLRVEVGAPHDIVESGYINGFKKEGQLAMQAAALWLKQGL